ncbi:hypothetical protein EJ04DRAFT_566373 [Polyplosphaeria fusca]|uniref:Uncharacterized protein n=1 Tax=Polyplosphaeria fusca TaxID=682080 RepID=A0A9P4UZ31_9PLEO|nr:hypothetical protein EJ04DRAFT_566373 [Polyplosphaeria fusca]
MTVSDLVRNCSTIPGYFYRSDDPQNFMTWGDPCHPYIDIPPQVKSLNPAWLSCTGGWGGGFFDPPKTLHGDDDLVPTTTQVETWSIAPTAGQSLTTPSITRTDINPTRAVETKHSRGPGSSQVVNPPTNRPTKRLSSGPVISMFLSVDPPVVLSSAPPREPPHNPAGTRDGPASSIVFTLFPTAASGQTHVVALTPTQIDGRPAAIIGSQILTPGATIPLPTTATLANGQTAQVSEASVFINSQGAVVFLDGTSTLGVVPLTVPTPPLVLTLNGHTYTEDASSRLIIDGQTLVPGGVITVSGTQIYLDPTATSVVIGGTSTMNLSPAQPTNAVTGVIKVSEETYVFAFDASGGLVIDGQTLLPGSTIVVGGTTSTAASGEVVVVGGTTMSLAPGATQLVVDGTTVPMTRAGTYVVGEATVTGTVVDKMSMTQGSGVLETGGSTGDVEGARTTGVSSTRGKSEGERVGRVGWVVSMMVAFGWMVRWIMGI